MTTMRTKNVKYKEYPRVVYLHLTQQCNLSCVYCYLNAGKYSCSELTSDTVKQLLCQIAAFQPRKLIFTGGEPLMREDLLELALYFRKLRHPSSQLCLDTNGTLINSNIASTLVKLFDEIRISLDGFEEVNDRLRGRGSFKSAIRAIGELREAGGAPSIAITLTSMNATMVSYFIHYMCHEWGIRKIRINPVKSIGRAKNRPDIIPGNEHDNLHSFSSFPVCDSNSPCNGDGSCIGTTISITPQGLAYPCHWLSQKEYYVGDMRVEKLGLIYERLDKLRQKLLLQENKAERRENKWGYLIESLEKGKKKSH